MNKRMRKKWAKRLALEANIFTEAQNDIDQGVQDEKVEIEKDEEKYEKEDFVLEEAKDIVEASNDMYKGFEKANPHLIRKEEEKYDPDEWNPDAVIDEKIKEEQKEGVENDLKDEIVDALD